MSKMQYLKIAVLFFLTWATAVTALAQDKSDKSIGGDGPKDATTRFVSSILGETEVSWKAIFAEQRRHYHEPKLVLYTGTVSSDCGTLSSDQGPRYCANDESIYIDLTFFGPATIGVCAKEPGCEFARAFVIAREVGHHVQQQLGLLAKIKNVKVGRSPIEREMIDRMSELQATCFAGIWANRVVTTIDPAEIEPGLAIAVSFFARLPKSVERFGTAEVRKRWFQAGFRNGTLSNCNTFENIIVLQP
jgi:predicted metalloprotease